MNKFIQVGPRRIGLDYPPLVIAEIGINHNGSLTVAKEMAAAAIHAGAEVIKHQTHIPDAEMSEEAKKTIPGNSTCSIYEIMARCALNETDERALKEFIEASGTFFLSTPFSFAAVDRLERFGVQAYKIGSGEMNNLPLIEYVAKLKKPIFLSTGMNNLAAVERTVHTITRYHDQFVLLHTTNLYPTPDHLIRLGALEQLKSAFPGEIIGLSDHSVDNLACLSAVALGASVLERHFTDSKNRTGEDICCSMDPSELTQLIKNSARVAKMRGGSKQATQEEQVTIEFAFSSVVTAKEIPAGKKIEREDLTTKRPAGGIPAAELDTLLGKTAKKHLPAGVQLRREDLA